MNVWYVNNPQILHRFGPLIQCNFFFCFTQLSNTKITIVRIVIKFIQFYVSSKPYLFFDIDISVMIVCMLNILRITHSSLSLYLIPSPMSRTHILCNIKCLEQHFLFLGGILKKLEKMLQNIYVNYIVHDHCGNI